jgi:hypothetical protein
MRLHPMERTAEAARQRRLGLAALVGAPVLMAALVALLHGPAAPLGDDWIFFSHFDHASLGEAMLTNSAKWDGERFRPFCYAHIWLERHLLGGSFAVNRWIGVVYLGLCGSMLALLLTVLRAPLAKAVLAGLLLVAHPAQAEVHGWATARIDTMATCFGLMALWLHCRERRTLSGLAFLAAFLSKESAYPLAVLPALHDYLHGRSWRRALRAVVPVGLALALTVASKLIFVGALVPSWATVDIPLGARLDGWLTYLQPLLLMPEAKGAPSGPLDLLAGAFTGLLVLGVLVSAVRVLVVHPTTKASEQPLRQRLLPPLWLAAGFGLALLVTGGVPVRADFSGGRLWLLPCAFLVGLIVYLSHAVPTWMALLPSTLLLLGNLAPYREANRMMQSVVDRVTAEVRDPKRAVRVSGLPAWHGPVPLFALMTNYFAESLGPGFDRALLWRDDQEADAAEMARWDAKWLLLMGRQQRQMVFLRWQDGELQEVRSPAPSGR